MILTDHFLETLKMHTAMLPDAFSKDGISEPENDIQLEKLARFDELQIVVPPPDAKVLWLGASARTKEYCFTQLRFAEAHPERHIAEIYADLKMLAECGVAGLSQEAASTKVAVKNRSELYGKWTLVENPITSTFYYVLRLDIPFVIYH